MKRIIVGSAVGSVVLACAVAVLANRPAKITVAEEPMSKEGFEILRSAVVAATTGSGELRRQNL